jgi:hypothetical protein
MVATSTTPQPATPPVAEAPLTRPAAPAAMTAEVDPLPSPNSPDYHLALYNANSTEIVRTNSVLCRSMRRAARVLEGMQSGTIPFDADRFAAAKAILRIRPLTVPRPVVPRAPRAPRPPAPSAPTPTSDRRATSSPHSTAAATTAVTPRPASEPAPLSSSQVATRLRAELEQLKANLAAHQPELERLQKDLASATNPVDRDTRRRRLENFISHQLAPLHSRLGALSDCLSASDRQAITHPVPTPL